MRASVRDGRTHEQTLVNARPSVDARPLPREHGGPYYGSSGELATASSRVRQGTAAAREQDRHRRHLHRVLRSALFGGDREGNRQREGRG
jgi:hypothetical protein